MNKLKKTLSVVLSMGLVASTLVIPMTANAADGDFIHKVTFDEAADATGVFGVGDPYEVVAGTDPTTVHASAENRPAANKLAKLSDGHAGTLADASDGSYLFSENYASTADVNHATLQFDVLTTNSYNAFQVMPAGNGAEDGAMLRYGIVVENSGGDNRHLKASNVASGWSHTDTEKTFTRLKWHEIAIEYDLENSVAYVYFDGEKVDTYKGVSGTKVPGNFIFKMTDTSNGVFYIDNLYYYKGAYNANVKDPSYPLASYDYNSDSTAAAGFAGKAASDKVHKATTANENVRPLPYGYNSVTEVTAANAVTYEAEVYVPSNGRAVYHVYNSNSTNNNNRVTFDINNGTVKADIQSGWASAELDNSALNADTWNKLVVEMDKDANTVKFYLNGVLISTVSGKLTTDNKFNSDFGVSNMTIGAAVDNLKMTPGKYAGDAAIAAVSGAVDGTITIADGTSVDKVKAMVTDGKAELYKSDLTTVATTVEDGNVLIISNGDLFKSYKIKVTTPYATKLLWLDYTNTNDIYEGSNGGNTGTQADGFAGKSASDKVSYHTDAYRPHDWGTTFTSDTNIVSYEAQVYVPDTATRRFHVYNNTKGETTRAVVKFADGAAKYSNNNTDFSDESVAIEANTWNKVVIVRNKNAGTYSYYVNGKVLAKDVAATSSTAANTFSKDIGFEVGTGLYVDNLRVYTGDYGTMVDTAIAEVTGGENGALKVPMNSTLTSVKAMVTDGTAEIYKSDLKTVSTKLTSGDVLIINKGELYKSYVINVATKYDGAILSTNFNGSSVDYTGDFTTLTTSAWVRTNDNRENDAQITYTQPGGKDSKALTITNAANNGSLMNSRFQTGWGSDANSKYSSGTYTVEAQLYNVEGAMPGNVYIKMRAATNPKDTAPKIFALDAPSTPHKWYKLAITVDTENKTVKGYINGEEADVEVDGKVTTSLTVDGVDYTNVTDQINVTAGEHSEHAVTTAMDNIRIYSGAYKGDTMPELKNTVNMSAYATVTDVIRETGADFVVDTNGKVVTSGSVATGYMAVKQNEEVYAYCDVNVTTPVVNEDVLFTTLSTGSKYTANGVDYIFMAVTTPTITDISLYDTFRVTDGTVVKEIALSEMMTTTMTGSVQFGVLVMNVPDANKDNFCAKLVLAD